ncbi:hypothetical protein GW17_00017896 [Ensete ventricosum]|nr:hypothetical protein GW17_00017896 [Ensete ventricosum]RZR99026.1 hypothetical protein BHM03_00028494 [Ensete ventricosum]
MIVRNQWAGSTIVRRRVNQRHYHVTITCEWKLPFSSLARLRFSRFDNRKGFSYPNASHPLSIACATGRGPWGGPNPWLTFRLRTWMKRTNKNNMMHQLAKGRFTYLERTKQSFQRRTGTEQGKATDKGFEQLRRDIDGVTNLPLSRRTLKWEQSITSRRVVEGNESKDTRPKSSRDT